MRRVRSGAGRSAFAAALVCVAMGLSGGSAVAADRAFELVSPVDSLAYVVAWGGFSSPDGDLVVYSSPDSLAGAVPNGPATTLDSYTARRGPDGWSTFWSTDAAESEPGTAGSLTVASNADGTRQIMMTENSIDPTDTVAHSNDPYLRVSPPNGERALSWITPGGPRTQSVDGRSFYAATADLGTILVSTPISMAPEDTDTVVDLYLVRDGVYTLVTPGTAAAAQISPTWGRRAAPGVLAADASYVYFTTNSPLVPGDTDTQGDVYRWDEGGQITHISPRRRTLTGGLALPVSMLGVSSDGDRSCFSTRKRLLDGDEENVDDVYCMTLSSDTLERVSAGLNDGDANAATGLALSSDGSSVFFSTVTALSEDDTDGGLSLYVRRGGQTIYVSKLDATDTMTRRAASSQPGQRTIRASADGTVAIFSTAASATARGCRQSGRRLPLDGRRRAAEDLARRRSQRRAVGCEGRRVDPVHGVHGRVLGHRARVD